MSIPSFMKQFFDPPNEVEEELLMDEGVVSLADLPPRDGYLFISVQRRGDWRAFMHPRMHVLHGVGDAMSYGAKGFWFQGYSKHIELTPVIKSGATMVECTHIVMRGRG